MSSTREIRKQLSAVGVRPTKARGQNFLTDDGIAARIAAFARIEPGAPVLEIGPGLGILTRELLAHTPRVTAVEIELELASDLRQRFPGLEVIEGDIRSVALAQLATDEKIYVVGNIPYSISSEVILWVLSQIEHVRAASFLLQREFAERIAATPGNRSYGSLTVQRIVVADAELGEIIPGEVFVPPTKVESRVLRLTPLRCPRVEIADAARFELVVRGAFSQRRKTILNSLSAAGIWPDKESARLALERSGIDPGTRAESVTVEQFAALACA